MLKYASIDTFLPIQQLETLVLEIVPAFLPGLQALLLNINISSLPVDFRGLTKGETRRALHPGHVEVSWPLLLQLAQVVRVVLDNERDGTVIQAEAPVRRDVLHRFDCGAGKEVVAAMSLVIFCRFDSEPSRRASGSVGGSRRTGCIVPCGGG